jgi:hypothetical protein
MVATISVQMAGGIWPSGGLDPGAQQKRGVYPVVVNIKRHSEL